MQVSAEIRWFWPGSPPPTFQDWFWDAHAQRHECPPGGGNWRSDEYSREAGQIELGLKYRGSTKGVEVKGLVAVIPSGLVASPFSGPIEIWTKWISQVLELNPNSTVTTEKRRWLRKFDTAQGVPKEIPLDDHERPIDSQPLPVQGCNVELTLVKLPQNNFWWTFGFEAFGSPQTVESNLLLIAGIIADRRPPGLGSAIRASYPAWLNNHILV